MSVQPHTHTFELPTVPDWDDAGWVIDTTYSEGAALLHNGASYQVKEGQDHTSAASNEPGVGASWGTFWRVIAQKGGTGDAGADGFLPGKRLNFSTTTTAADPGDGNWRRNHATFASVTALYIDNEDNAANSLTAWLDSLDDRATTADRGRLTAVKADDPDVWEEYIVTGSVTDSTGFRTVSVTPVGDGAALTDGVETVFVFRATGEPGAGAVDSVNGQTGAVVLDPDDLDDTSTTNKFATAGQLAKVDYLTVTQAVDLDQMETDIAALANGMVYKGDWDASSGSFPGGGSAQTGWFYNVSVGGTVDGVEFAASDAIIAKTDNASTTTYAANWTKKDSTDAVQTVVGQVGDVTAQQIATAIDADATAENTLRNAIPATDSAKGTVELATPAEIDTGTDTERAITSDALAGSKFGTPPILITAFEYTTDVATGDGAGYFTIPSVMAGMNLVGVHARVIAAGTTGTTDIQIHNVTQAADMLSTKLTIDSGETGSDSASTPAVIDGANDDVAAYDLIRIDVDAVSSTAPKGLLILLEFKLP